VSRFIKGGIYSAWTLIHKEPAGNTSTLYPAFANYSGSGIVDEIKIPDVDLSALLSPTVLSTFTASNGTSLDAITPEVGASWVEQNGDWDIQSNNANATGTPPAEPNYIATQETGVADCYIRAKVTMASGGTVAIIFRYTDNDNHWMVQISTGETLIRIYERNAGTWTSRTSVISGTKTAGVEYTLVMRCRGTTIDAWVDDNYRISYASASLNQTATKHGIRGNVAGDKCGEFAVYPSGTSNEYITLDDY